MRSSGQSIEDIVVVLVEDEAIIAMMMEDAMVARGFGVRSFTSAEGALAYMSDGGEVDVLFTDINLAGPTRGDALAKDARALRRDLGVIYASGTQDAVGAAVPGSLFFPKPYSPAQVCDAIARVAAPVAA